MCQICGAKTKTSKNLICEKCSRELVEREEPTDKLVLDIGEKLDGFVINKIS